MPVIMAESTTTAPTDRSMPPVMITVVMPSAMMPTKAKLRVTLKMLRSVAKVSVASDSAMQAATAAMNTQNVWRLRIQLSAPACICLLMDFLKSYGHSACLFRLADKGVYAVRMAPVMRPVTSSGELSDVSLSATLVPRRSTTIRSATAKTSGMR